MNDRPTRGRMSLAALMGASVVIGLLPMAISPVVANAAADHLVFTTQPGDGTPGGALAAQPQVTIEDSSNATVSTSSTVTLTLTGPAGAALTGLLPTLNCAQTSGGITSLAASSGVATFSACSVSRGGLYTLTATDGADSLTRVSAQFFVSGPAQLAVTAQPGGGTAGTAWSTQPQVTVEDAHGITVGGSSASIGLAIKSLTGTAGATLSCTNTTVSASSGVASFAGCAIDKTGTGYQLVATDSTDKLISPASSAFDVTAGAAAALVFTTQPSGGGGGTAFGIQPVVTVVDAGGNTVAGNADSIALGIKSSTGTLGASLTCTTTPLPAVAGVATFAGCAIDDSGSGYKLTASDSTHSLSVDSGSFTISAGAAAHIAFSTQPGGGAGGGAFATQPVVTLTDAGGNPVSGAVLLGITPTTGTPGAHLTCTINPLAAAAGTATFAGCSVDQTGTGYKLTATSAALSVDSSTFDISGGAAAHAQFTTQPGGGTGGSAFATQPVVALTDAGSNPAAGAVTLSITPGTGAPGAALHCAANTVSAIGGTATFSGCSVDKQGVGYTLKAISGPATATSAAFTVTVGSPAQLTFTAQPGGGTGGLPWAAQPIVSVRDAGGNQIPTSTAAIALAVTPGTGAGTLTCGSLPLPAVNGAALFSGCAIDKTAGAYTLTATDAADSLTVTSAAFGVTAGPPAHLRFSTQPGGAAAAGVVFPTQPAVSVVDAGGNTVPGSSASIALSLTPGTGTPGAALTCAGSPVTASSGVATFAGCAVNRAASGYTVTANDSADSLSVESLPFAILAPPPQPLGVAPTGVPVAQTFGGRLYGVNPTAVADDVNSATGALTFSATDLRVAGIGVPLVLQRTYNSNDTTGGSFGPGWTSLLDVSVKVVPLQTMTVRGEDGQQLVWTWNAATSSWTPPPGSRTDLKCGSKQCSLTRFDGTRIDVNLIAGGGSQIADYLAPDGQGLTFAWSASQVKITVASTKAAPYNVTVSLNGPGRVTAVSTPAGRTLSYTYAAGGLLTSVTDVRGNAWTYAYASNRLTTEIDPLGNVRLSASYDGATGRVTAVSSKGGPQHTDDTFTYDAPTQTATRLASASAGGFPVQEAYSDRYLNNVLVSQTMPSGAITRYSYDARVNLVEVQDPMGWVAQMAYDPNNNLVSQSTPITATSAATIHMEYDPAHRVTSQTDADGNVTNYVYNGPNLGFIRPPVPTNPGTSFTYNKVGELVQVVTPIGQQLYSYDAFGNPTIVLLETLGGQVLNGKGTLATYNEAGNMLTSVDPRGTTTGPASSYTTTRSYDAAGNLLSTATPGPQTTTTAYDAAGDVSSVHDAAGGTTSFAWNELALTRSTTVPGGTSTQRYDPSGNLLVETSATNRTTTHVYDGAGREVRTTDPANITVEYTYDIEGNVVAAADNAGDTLSREFDSLNRTIRSVSNGAVTLTGYDPASNVTSTTDAHGSVTTTAYNTHNLPASVSNAAGTTSYRYDNVDNVISRTDQNGHVTAYVYDAAGRQTSTSVNGNTTSYVYDPAGNVVKTTDPDGRTTTLTLDALNRPTSTVYAWTGHPPAITVGQQYDTLGRRVAMTDATGTHHYAYDAAGNMTSASIGSDTFSYDWSQPGKIVETYPDGTAVNLATDDAQNLMSVQVGTLGDPGYVKASYVRNTLRQTTGIALSNGVLETRQVDQAGNVLDQALQTAGTKLADNAFTYDAAHNRLSQVDNVGGTATSNQYGYDVTSRLTGFTSSTGLAPLAVTGAAPVLGPHTGTTPSHGTVPMGAATVAPKAPAGNSVSPAVAPAYSYDGAGNRISSVSGAGTTTSAYNAGDQVSSQSGPGGATTWQYDRNGDVTSITGPTSSQTFTYDAAARLVAVTTTPGVTVTYAYDGDGNRVSKTVGADVTKYVWDPAGAYPHLAIERTGSGTLIRRYIYGDGLVAFQTPAATYFAHLDPQGSVAELSDSSGAIVAAYHYDGFGNVTTVGASAPANPMLFQGQYLDGDTGLYNMRARNYDPATGRFTQRDPLAVPVSSPVVSPYVFANDRPTVFTDPTGREISTTSVFWGHNSLEANVATDINLGVKATAVALKVIPKAVNFVKSTFASSTTTVTEELAVNAGRAGGATSEVAAEAGSAAGAAGEVGGDLGPAAEALSGAGKVAKFAGIGLAVVGIGLQAFITVEDCIHGTVSQCVGDVVGTAISIGFTVGCTVATAGAGAVVCGLVGAILSVGLQYVIATYGPEIAAGVVSLYNDAAAGISQGVAALTSALETTGAVLADQFNRAGGVIATGFNKLSAAVSSGFQSAIGTLVDAGYSAVQLAGVLANTFNEGLKDAVAALVSFGYTVNAIAGAIANVFSTTAAEAAQLFKDGFNYTVAQVAGFLKDVYGLGDQVAAQILKNINYAVDEVASALQSVYNRAATVVAGILKNIGYGIQQIGAALQQVFNEVDQAVAAALKGLGYIANEVATALVNLYNDVDQAVAAALKFATYVVTEIATALHEVFNDIAQVAAGVLKTVGFVVNEVATALKDVYTFLDQAAAQVLENIGFAVNAVATALHEVFNDLAQATAQVLKNIGNTVNAIATALHEVFSELVTGAAQVLKDVGFVVNEVAAALQTVFSELAAGAAQVLKDIGFAINEVAAALQSVFAQAAQAAAQILKTIGYAVDAIAGALQSVFNQAAAAAASILKAIGYAAADIANALKDIFNQAAAAVASILKGINEAAADIAAVLGSIFHEIAGDIANLLSSLGFASDVIAAIGGAFASFGQSVADCFTSFFSDC